MHSWKLLALTVLLAGVFYGEARAHYLWIEVPQEQASQENKAVQLYYGEYEEGVREVAGGRLDEVTPFRIWVQESDSRRPIEMAKQADHFEGQTAAPAETLFLQAQELGRPVQDWARYGIGVVKPLYYTSAVLPAPGDEDAAVPAIPGQKTRLAVYPLSLGETSRLQVFYEGKPLANAKVKVHAPNQWSKEWGADENGIAEVTLPWPGRYVFEVIYKEEVPGEYQGVPYEAVRHRATFSWQRP